EPYTVSGISISAYGYTTANAASHLYGKQQGADETGLGMLNDSGNDFEIDPSHYIQLDFSQVLAAGATSGKLVISSVQAGETFAVYGSNTLGSLGTLLMSGTAANDNIAMAIPSFGTYKYIGVKATYANVLIATATFTFGNCSIVVNAAPSASCVSINA